MQVQTRKISKIWTHFL